MTASTRFLVLTALVFLLGAALLLPVGARAQASRTVSETVPLDADGRVTLDTFTGAIDVTTWDREAVQIDVRIEGDNQEAVDQTRIRIESSGNAVTIESDYDALERGGLFGLFGDDADRPATHYTIKLPATARLQIDDFSSEIQVTGLRADVELETFSGPVTLRNLEGAVSAETYSSELEAQSLRGRIDFETFSGDATIALTALTGDSSFESFSGDVTLALPSDAGFELEADMGMSGDLDSGFSLDNMRSGDDGYAGSVNGGGPRIYFTTFSGDFTLRAQ